MAGRRSGFGSIRKLPSGRWQARYVVPGTERSLTAPTTFDTRGDADTWLATVRADITRGAWMAPSATMTLAEYAEQWLGRVSNVVGVRAEIVGG